MKTTPFLDFYNECMKTGMMPELDSTGGLCYSAPNLDRDLIWFFQPDYAFGFWGYNGDELYAEDYEQHGISEMQLRYGFTPLRQTIVLFCAAINNEL